MTSLGIFMMMKTVLIFSLKTRYPVKANSHFPCVARLWVAIDMDEDIHNHNFACTPFSSTYRYLALPSCMSLRAALTSFISLL